MNKEDEKGNTVEDSNAGETVKDESLKKENGKTEEQEGERKEEDENVKETGEKEGQNEEVTTVQEKHEENKEVVIIQEKNEESKEVVRTEEKKQENEEVKETKEKNEVNEAEEKTEKNKEVKEAKENKEEIKEVMEDEEKKKENGEMRGDEEKKAENKEVKEAEGKIEENEKAKEAEEKKEEEGGTEEKENNENLASQENSKNQDLISSNQEPVESPALKNSQLSNTGVKHYANLDRSPYGSNNVTYQPNLSIDFSADINLNQLNEHASTNENFSSHSSETEHNAFSYAPQVNSKNSPSIEGKANTDTAIEEHNISPKEEKPSVRNCDNSWYEQKIAEKEAIINERLSKLGRVLGVSYPCYEKWLAKMKRMHGTPVCKVEPVRRCDLSKPYANRWKFTCITKQVQIPKKESNDENTAKEDGKIILKLEMTDAKGANVHKGSELPPFILRAVKTFEDFLQPGESNKTPKESDADDKKQSENFSDDICLDTYRKSTDASQEPKQLWSWLLIRCNSMDELMLFATGKNISHETMERLKYVYESGPGKDCNIKSLYCKSINRVNDTTFTNTTFLMGSEALDEVVGNLKIQLAPKTNFWSNSAGAANVARAVSDLLAPSLDTTVLEVGCGIGLIGLMLASKCKEVIGVDSQSEVEEAEMTCELNSIKNASFITGTSEEVIQKIYSTLKNQESRAIVNANTAIGREIAVMTCLRKIPTLRRIVMVTTLTKQSVRAILELARPMDNGHPFVPVRACVVDTVPVGPYFEVVILMDRIFVHKINQQQWFLKPVTKNMQLKKLKKALINKAKRYEANKAALEAAKASSNTLEAPPKTGPGQTAQNPPFKKVKPLMTFEKPVPGKYSENLLMKGKFKDKFKRACSSDKNPNAPPKKMIKQSDNFAGTSSYTDVGMRKRKRSWPMESPPVPPDSLQEKRMREYNEQAGLRERLSKNRDNTDIAQKIREHQNLLEMAKEKLSGPTPMIDIATAKQLQNMLNMVLEQTNNLQNQLPRSVWNRISPVKIVNHSPDQEEHGQSDSSRFRGRYVQEIDTQNIIVTTSNEQFLNDDEPMMSRRFKKFSNIPPMEPNLVVPSDYVRIKKEEEPFNKKPSLMESNHYSEQNLMEKRYTEQNLMEKRYADQNVMENRYTEKYNQPPRQERESECSLWTRDRGHRSNREDRGDVKSYETRRWNETESMLPSQRSNRSFSPMRMSASSASSMEPREYSVNKLQSSPFFERRMPSPVRTVSPLLGREIMPSKRNSGFDVWESNSHMSAGTQTKNSTDRKYSLDRPLSPPRQYELSGKQYIPDMHSTPKFSANRGMNVQSSNSPMGPSSSIFGGNVWKKEPVTPEKTMNSSTYRKPTSEEKWGTKAFSRDNSPPNWNNKPMYGQSSSVDNYQESDDRCSMSYNKGSSGGNNNWNSKGRNNFGAGNKQRVNMGQSRQQDKWSPSSSRVQNPWDCKTEDYSPKPKWQSNSNQTMTLGESYRSSQIDFGKKFSSYSNNPPAGNHSAKSQRFFNNQFKDFH